MKHILSHTYMTFVFSVQTIKSFSRIKENKKRSHANKETIIIRYRTMTKDAPKEKIKPGCFLFNRKTFCFTSDLRKAENDYATKGKIIQLFESQFKRCYKVLLFLLFPM